MMDMRPEDFPKKELNFEEISGGLNRLDDEQLYKLESWIQDLRERRKTERRRNEIIAELNDLFAELVEMDCCLFFNTGKGYPVEVEGSIYEQGAGQIYIN